MNQLTLEAKESIILQVLNRKDTSIESIARLNNVGVSTLGRWLRNYRAGKSLSYGISEAKVPHDLRRQAQLNHMIATHHLDELSLGEYCRQHGLYSHQLNQWREEFMKDPISKQQAFNSSKEIKALQAENKALKKELRRKDKALAETSALLILKKKAHLIWGESEED